MLYSFGLENALEVRGPDQSAEAKLTFFKRAKMDISFFLLNVYEAATVSRPFSPTSIRYTDIFSGCARS